MATTSSSDAMNNSETILDTFDDDNDMMMHGEGAFDMDSAMITMTDDVANSFDDEPYPDDSATVVTIEPVLSGRPPNMLYLSCDPDNLSPYQVLIRKHMEIFEALPHDVQSTAQGRNKPIVLGQIGIRCRYCTHVFPLSNRAKGNAYYPAKLLSVYQAAQSLANTHFLGNTGGCATTDPSGDNDSAKNVNAGCPWIPGDLREELCLLRDLKSSSGGGKQHWAKTVHALGVYEDEYGLRYGPRPGYFHQKQG